MESLALLHLMTNAYQMELLVEMEHGKDSAWAHYSSFTVDDEANKFRLSVSDYDPASTAGDGLTAHDGKQWSSPD